MKKRKTYLLKQQVQEALEEALAAIPKNRSRMAAKETQRGMRVFGMDISRIWMPAIHVSL